MTWKALDLELAEMFGALSAHQTADLAAAEPAWRAMEVERVRDWRERNPEKYKAGRQRYIEQRSAERAAAPKPVRERKRKDYNADKKQRYQQDEKYREACRAKAREYQRRRRVAACAPSSK